jgi:hypothetical protein
MSPNTDDPPGRSALNYTVVAQTAEDVQNVENSPAISMIRYLTDRKQLTLVPTISIYAERGTDRDHIRLLYMNAVALRIWKEMGMRPTEIGMRHRPTRTAVLAFGMPFSE